MPWPIYGQDGWNLQVYVIGISLKHFTQEEKEMFQSWFWCGLINDSGGELHKSNHG